LAKAVQRDFDVAAAGRAERFDVFRLHQCDGGFAMRAGDLMPGIFSGEHDVPVAQGAEYFDGLPRFDLDPGNRPAFPS